MEGGERGGVGTEERSVRYILVSRMCILGVVYPVSLRRLSIDDVAEQIWDFQGHFIVNFMVNAA